MSGRPLFTLLTLLGTLFGFGVQAPVFAAERPNIVLIYADDLGYGDVSCNGATRISTPNVDRLAREGLNFTDAHSASATCTPSRYAMLTGEYAWRKPGTGILSGTAPLIIAPGRQTLASLLQSAGYTTGVVGKWHLGLGEAGLDWNGEISPGPLEVGFDECFLVPATGDRVPCVYVEGHHVIGLDPQDPLQVNGSKPVGNEPTGMSHPELLKLLPSGGHNMTIVNGIGRIGYMAGGHSARWVDEDMADTLAARGVRFIEEHAQSPFFLYFSTHDIHVPRVPHSRFAGQTPLGARGDVIVQFDWCVGEILKTLDRLNLTEKTLVILTSDNGPVVDDGYQDRAAELLGEHRPAGPWRGGKYSLYEGGTRVPFITRWPGHISPGVTSSLVCQVDLLASFAALVNETVDVETAPDSQNVLPALLGKANEGRTELVEHGGGLAFRSGDWKIIPRWNVLWRNTPPDGEKAPPPYLYHLKDDPGEEHDLSEVDPARGLELQRALLGVRQPRKP